MMLIGLSILLDVRQSRWNAVVSVGSCQCAQHHHRCVWLVLYRPPSTAFHPPMGAVRHGDASAPLPRRR
jgi:hypothetical protein